MTLTELHRSFVDEAKKLGDYGLLSKTELANGYCDAEDAEFAAIENHDSINAAKYNSIKSQYLAALMLRYWYKIFEWMNNSSSLLVEPEEYVDWLYKGFWVAFYYRTWRDEYKATYKDGHFIEWKLDDEGNKILNPYYWVNDPNAPDKIFNRCIFSIRGREYQFFNKQKRKDGVHKASLDAMLDEDGDCAAVYSGAYAEDTLSLGVRSLIEELIKRDELLEAVIADSIINTDCFKVTKTDSESQNIFDARKLVKQLNKIDKKYLAYFCTEYNVRPQQVATLSEKFDKMTNQKFYKLIEKFRQEMLHTPSLLSLLQD